jgi:hypothetical protein
VVATLEDLDEVALKCILTERVECGNGVLEFQEEVYLPLGLARLVTSRQRFNGQPAVTNKLVSGFLRCRGVIFCHE